MNEPKVMTNEELQKQFEYYTRNAKPFVGKPPRIRKSSLERFIKTQKQADELMAQLRALSSRKSDSSAC
jgi:hypothetical protein